jgi:hypothetical protein
MNARFILSASPSSDSVGSIDDRLLLTAFLNMDAVRGSFRWTLLKVSAGVLRDCTRNRRQIVLHTKAWSEDTKEHALQYVRVFCKLLRQQVRTSRKSISFRVLPSGEAQVNLRFSGC